MKQEGPLLETLLRRLAECPEDFLRPVDAPGKEGLSVEALVCDLLRVLRPNAAPESDLALRTAIRDAQPRTRRLIAIVTWMLHDPWFLEHPELAAGMARLPGSPNLAQLAALVKPESAIQDPDRREELARLCLRVLDLRPLGESPEQATDRLTMLDSAERQRILRATAAAERRAREVREAMARARAAEASSRYGE